MSEYPACPYCGKEIDPWSIMGVSDWEDQQYDPYVTECPHCEKQIKITLEDIEIKRFYYAEKAEAGD